MKVVTLAQSTLDSFLHNRLIVVILVLAMCVVLLMLVPLLGAKAATTLQNKQAMESMVLEVISQVMSFVSGLGSLLAAWAACDSLSTELKTGTVLAVMARPVRRWEFLLGKYLGVLLLMTCYVLMMLAVSYLLAWLGGGRLHVTPWILFVYPLVRYAIYAAIAMLLTTWLHPIFSMGVVLMMALVTELVSPGVPNWRPRLMWLKSGLYYILPSMNLLTEGRFLSLRQASVKQTTWLEHGTSLAYGLDMALVFILLAMWSFHYRTLRRD
jgi:ABC-type transport system involved in multi-copper enzyme maturation permease subunit